MLGKIVPIGTLTSPSNMGHVTTRPMKGGFSTFKLDKNGVMLRVVMSICKVPLFFDLPWQSLECNQLPFLTCNHFM